MASRTVAIGNAEIKPILDVEASMPLDALFDGSGDPPPGGRALATSHPEDFTAEGWRFRVHCFLVRTPTRLTLIDAGAGPADSAVGRWLVVGGTLPDELAAVGVAPDDVGDVILTHIHSDHIGWSTVRSSGGGNPGSPTPGTSSIRPASRGCATSRMRKACASSPRRSGHSRHPDRSTPRRTIARCRPASTFDTLPATRPDIDASSLMPATSGCCSPAICCISRSS